MTIDVVLPVRAQLGECPLWCGRTGRLWWIDIEARAIHRTDPSSGTDEVRTLPGRPGSIALRRDVDHLLVALEHELCDYDWTTGTVTLLTRLEADGTPTRLNDGRCDPAGRFWVGSMDDPLTSGNRAGSLHRVGPDLASSTHERGIGVSNALVFDGERATMYWGDSLRATIWAYDVDAASGDPSNRRVFAEFGTALPGAPDGACLDAEGCMWVACVNGWRIARITPAGVVDRLIEVPVEKPTMPAFGGPGLDTLFLTSISVDGPRPLAPNQPLAGALLALDVGVTGVAEPIFAG